MSGSVNITTELLREIISTNNSSTIGNTYNFYNYTNCYNKDDDDDIYTADIQLDSVDQTTDVPTSIPISNIGARTRTAVIPIPLNTSTQDISNRVQSAINNIINSTDLPNVSEITTSLRLPGDSDNNTSETTGLSMNTLNSGTEVFICNTVGDKCSICNELYEEHDICRKNIKCGHIFHQACIDTWYGEHSHCPICNQNIE